MYKIYKNANNKQQQSTWIKSRSLLDDSAKKKRRFLRIRCETHIENRLFLLQRSSFFLYFYALFRFVLLVRIVIFRFVSIKNCISTQIQQFSYTKILYINIFLLMMRSVFFLLRRYGSWKTKTMFSFFSMSKNTKSNTRNTCWAKCIRSHRRWTTNSFVKKMQRNLNAS